MEKEKEFVKESTAAKLLDVTPQTIRMWRYREAGPPFVRIGRTIRYNVEQIRKWAKERTVYPTRTPTGKPAFDKKKYLSPRQVSDLLGFSLVTLQSWRTRGEGPPWIRIGRRVYYEPDEILGYAEKNKIDVTAR